MPFSTVTVVSFGGGAFAFTFSPSATAVAFFGDSTSGFAHCRTAAEMFSDDVVRSEKPSSPSIRDWNTWPGGSEYARTAYESTVLALTSLPPPCATSMLLVSTLITFGSFVEREVRADLILEGADEDLLAGVAVEVAVRVPEPDEVERLVAVRASGTRAGG